MKENANEEIYGSNPKSKGGAVNPCAAILWFRQDLRLQDNPALVAAAAAGRAIVPVFIWAPEEEGDWPPGAASRWWLHHSLAALEKSLRKIGVKLIFRRSPAAETLLDLARETGAREVYFNRRYEPAAIGQERRVEAAMNRESIVARSFNSALLREPWTVATTQGGPYKVFTPFWRAVRGDEPEIQPFNPNPLSKNSIFINSLALNDLELLPEIDWAAGLRETWRPGEAGAWENLRYFIEETSTNYATDRDRPDRRGTSRLSPHLHWGEIGPRHVLAALRNAAMPGEGAAAAERQLFWREFAYHLLYHFPRTPEAPLRPEFRKFPWRRSAKDLRAWQRGRTGFPIVDAAMRELWATGWMHNRARMIAGSFLVKDLLLSWREGERWFWETLVDADLANNTLGWQWIAGCGADAAPYFRIFNPALQAAKFDPDGEYAGRWAPEYRAFPQQAPKPVVDHSQARDRALAAYAAMKNSPHAKGDQ